MFRQLLEPASAHRQAAQATCTCGHTRSGHYRERGVCVKVSCDCSCYAAAQRR